MTPKPSLSSWEERIDHLELNDDALWAARSKNERVVEIKHTDLISLLTTAKEEGREEERLFKVRLEDEIRQLKRRSDSSTYLYGQGESHAYEEVLKLLSPSIRKEEI